MKQKIRHPLATASRQYRFFLEHFEKRAGSNKKA
jgi:hypothetical protein